MYDIVVVGGGTSGCAAAYAAGKLGLKTLLLEKEIHLGGTITSGLVIPVMKAGDNQINTDFYNNLIIELQAIGGQTTYQDNPGWFNPELVKIALDNMMEKSNVEVRFNSFVCNIYHKDRLITEVDVNTNMLSVCNYALQSDSNTLFEPIVARYIVDASGNCEIGKLLNCEFLNDYEKYQPMSLRFIMSGINLRQFGKWLEVFDTNREVTTVEHIGRYTHLSTACTWDSDKHWALQPLFEDAIEKGLLKDTDSNYFQIFTVSGMPDSITFNCPRICEELDPLKIKDRSHVLLMARKAILRLANFCRIYFPGFKNAYISNIADSLGVRVSNRIKGKYVYTLKDMKAGKVFKNPAVVSNYPVDVHSKDKNASALIKMKEYQLPIESLMSNDFDNLFVIGRCISADYMAQGAIRVQSSCFSMGEAVAKYINANLV